MQHKGLGLFFVFYLSQTIAIKRILLLGLYVLFTCGLRFMATYKKVESGWRVEVCVNGKRKSKTMPGKAEAKAWAAEMEHQLSLTPKISGTSETHTLGDIFIRYADEVSEHKKGARWEGLRLAAFGRDLIAEILLKDLRREHLEDYIQRRLKTVKSSTANREMNLISHCLTEARRWRLMESNPFNDLKRPKNPPHRDRRISVKEIEIISVASGYSDNYPVIEHAQRVAVAFLLAIESAMRAGEICAIRTENINLAEQTIHLPDSKNGFARKVPLSKYAVKLLEKLLPWPDDNKPVFRMASGTLSTVFAKTVGMTNIEGLTFHDTRHEAITRLAGKLDILDLARMAGIRDLKQLMTYYNKTATEIAGQLG
jgi:integrase